MNDVIQSLWIGDSLSAMERLSVSSFLDNDHPYHLYVYDEVAGIPDGVTVLDANEIVPRDRIFKYKDYDSYAGFANLFRYKLLLKKGGYWADTDIVCLKPFEHDSEYVFASETIEHPTVRDTQVVNCVIKAPADSAAMKLCYGEATLRNPCTMSWGDTGPQLLTMVVEFLSLWSYVAEPREFCPVSWWEWRELIGSDLNFEGSRAVHLYHEMWRRTGTDFDVSGT